MQSNQENAVHMVVEGRVQGVGFRYYTLTEAKKLSLSGWVRNTWDGKVEILVEGSQNLLQLFINRIRQGPSSSFVSDVKINWQEESGKFRNFDIKPTV
ncbi:MAG: acylphosphatase [Anaerolineaceae bacterium]|nr:acylphosphatase [Anaerolineaceae bacterium]